LEIQDSVIFSPPVANIEKEYLDSSIMVVSSRSEGFGMVLIEAMACGVPCVAFDCPHGPADIISHSNDGFLVEAENNDALATSIMNLIQNEELRFSMGIKAREHVKRYFPEHVMPQWHELFEQLI